MTIEEIRRDQQAKCNEVGLKVIKGMRFLLLRNYEKLDFKKKSSLESLLEANQPIALAHARRSKFVYFGQTDRKGVRPRISGLMIDRSW